MFKEIAKSEIRIIYKYKIDNQQTTLLMNGSCICYDCVFGINFAILIVNTVNFANECICNFNNVCSNVPRCCRQTIYVKYY